MALNGGISPMRPMSIRLGVFFAMPDRVRRHLDRRQVMLGSASLATAAQFSGSFSTAQALSGVSQEALGAPVPFSFDILKQQAQDLARHPYQAPDVSFRDVLDEITYDYYQHIRYRADKSVTLGRNGGAPVQFFHLGKYAMEPVRMHVVEGGKAREVIYTPDLFDIPAGHPARKLHAGAGFAGFRIMAPNLKTDWFAAMGASYFRTSGPFDQYGLSARGVAIDTAMPTPEEFPRFSQYWIAGDEDGDKGSAGKAEVTIYGLLDGISLTGAYKMRTTRRTDKEGVHRIDMDIDAELFARKDIVGQDDAHVVVFIVAAELNLEINKADADTEKQPDKEIVHADGKLHDLVKLLRRRPAKCRDVFFRHHRVIEGVVFIIKFDD